MIKKLVSYTLGILLLFLLVGARFWQSVPGSEISPDHQAEQSQSQALTEEEHGPAQDLNKGTTSHGQADLAHADAEADHGHTEEPEGFSPNDFIFDHILDAYEWHILSWDDFHLSIPLPVIVYSETKGLNVFLFSKFHHGHSDYRGFRYMKKGEPSSKVVEVMDDGSVQLPKLDLSFKKNALAILISLVMLMWIFISVAKAYRLNPGKAPRGMQNFVEPIIIFIRDDIAISSIGKQKAERFMPYLLTIFFFIFLNNLLGLVPLFPGGANVTGNITITMVLALFTFFMTAINGNLNYWTHIVNTPGVPWWLKIPIPMMPIIEIIGMFTKPFVLMVRLFANITAGHIIALGFFSLIFIFGEMKPFLGFAVSPLTLVFTIFMTMLEMLVALIQAYVFTLLSALYFGMATEHHH